MSFTHASFCSGIEGFGLAAEAAGWENVLHCEKNSRLRKLLEYYWPNAHSYDDITNADFTQHRNTIDVLSGGFPCQPFSHSGQRKGTDDERHLWPEMLRGIREIQPPWVVGENVRGIINWNEGLVFEQVQSDLEAEGYEILPFLLPAAGINAPHERYRTWFIAYSQSARNRRQGRFDENRQSTQSPNTQENKRKWIWNEPWGNVSKGSIADTPIGRIQRCEKFRSFEVKRSIYSEQSFGSLCPNWEKFPTQSPVCNGNDGIPYESLRSFIRDRGDGIITEEEIDQIVARTINYVRKETIQAGGNAVIPKLVLQIFMAINDFEEIINQNTHAMTGN